MYEYGPKIKPYSKSKMSNHVGINGLVFLSDGRLLVPRRNKASTISKDQITSSIAVKLEFPADGSQNITADYLLRQNLIENLSTRVKIRPCDLHPDRIRVRFLGFGQNLYEAGKPQFYFAVHLDDIDTEAYFKLAQMDSTSKIDVDKCIYVADYQSFQFRKDALLFDVVDPHGKKRQIKACGEMSYYANLWHYEKLREQS